jgi:hypothetical protein
MFQLPKLYNDHLKKEFNSTQYLVLLILINLLQNLKSVRLEELARRFPHPILLRSRIKKLQRFLSLSQFQIEKLWFPIFTTWTEEAFDWGEVLYVVIDRSQWRGINLLMVSLVYDHRAIPIYCCLLSKKGNSNLSEQQKVLKPVLQLLKNYKIVVLGDREWEQCRFGEVVVSRAKGLPVLKIKMQ